MITQEINIRDPFVLLHEKTYYLYGTRSSTCWGPAKGFDCYKSSDLTNWEGPIEIFRNDGSFWADRSYWAPECVSYNGSFYLLATFGSATRKKGVQILKSDSPTGLFAPISEGPVTREDWTCIDGTLYVRRDGKPFLVFSHSFEDSPGGDMCAVELTRDLTKALGRPWLLFQAASAPWARPVPFARAEFGLEGDVYFTDGPFCHRTTDGRLLMLWSSWGKTGYEMGLAHSDNGELDGAWSQESVPIYDENGGHGMIFRGNNDALTLLLHYPNDKEKERPLFLGLAEVKQGGITTLRLQRRERIN